jgi:hypothetical protein
MADLEFTDAARGYAMVRAADALLRTLGPSEITLLLPIAVQQANADLGLATPVVEQVLLSPVVVRSLPSSQGTGRTRLELLLSASTVAAQAEVRGLESPTDLFESALGVIQDSKLLRIESIGSDSFAGVPYLYRVTAVE